MMIGTMWKVPMNRRDRQGEDETRFDALLTSLPKGFMHGRKIRAPIKLLERWTSQTLSAVGSPVARAAIITSKTVPKFAPRI